MSSTLAGRRGFFGAMVGVAGAASVLSMTMFDGVAKAARLKRGDRAPSLDDLIAVTDEVADASPGAGLAFEVLERGFGNEVEQHTHHAPIFAKKEGAIAYAEAELEKLLERPPEEFDNRGTLQYLGVDSESLSNRDRWDLYLAGDDILAGQREFKPIFVVHAREIVRS